MIRQAPEPTRGIGAFLFSKAAGRVWLSFKVSLRMFAPHLTTFILQSRQRPAMYWGDNSLRSVAHYVDGFSDALFAFGTEHRKEVFPKIGFTVYVAARLKRMVGGHLWYGMLLDAYADDGTALTRFYELYEEFVKAYSIESARGCSWIVRYPQLRGSFVVTNAGYDWGDFVHFSSLKKAREFLATKAY